MTIHKKISELTKKKREKIMKEYSEVLKLKKVANELDDLKNILIYHTHPQNSQNFNNSSEHFRKIVTELLQQIWSGFCNFDDQLKKHNYLKVADESTLLFKELEDIYNENTRKRGA